MLWDAKFNVFTVAMNQRTSLASTIVFNVGLCFLFQGIKEIQIDISFFFKCVFIEVACINDNTNYN